MLIMPKNLTFQRTWKLMKEKLNNWKTNLKNNH